MCGNSLEDKILQYREDSRALSLLTDYVFWKFGKWIAKVFFVIFSGWNILYASIFWVAWGLIRNQKEVGTVQIIILFKIASNLNGLFFLFIFYYKCWPVTIFQPKQIQLYMHRKYSKFFVVIFIQCHLYNYFYMRNNGCAVFAF